MPIYARLKSSARLCISNWKNKRGMRKRKLKKKRKRKVAQRRRRRHRERRPTNLEIALICFNVVSAFYYIFIFLIISHAFSSFFSASKEIGCESGCDVTCIMKIRTNTIVNYSSGTYRGKACMPCHNYII